MIFNRVILIFFLFSFISFNSQSQFQESNDLNNYNFFEKTHISLEIGNQMSGIKSQDFVSSNYSPLVRVSLLKKLNEYIDIRFGYQGSYFYLISDSLRHNYDFYFLDYFLGINKFDRNFFSFFSGLHIHAGTGLLYNYDYQAFNFCAIFGICYKIKATKKMFFTIDCSTVLGWDIYQGDEDILPSLSFGLVYKLKN